LMGGARSGQRWIGPILSLIENGLVLRCFEVIVRLHYVFLFVHVAIAEVAGLDTERLLTVVRLTALYGILVLAGSTVGAKLGELVSETVSRWLVLLII